jgi:putative tricarboxylic transport membrane protein
MYTGIGDAAWSLIQPGNLLWLGLGTVLGLIAGTLPGISGVSMMALMLPFTFGMPTETSVLMLVGVYASATYSDTVRKTLLYAHIGDRWRIISDTSEAIR